MGKKRIFKEAMKYFRHILMGHEIILNIFGGPQNIYNFSKFIWKFKWVWTVCPKWPSREFNWIWYKTESVSRVSDLSDRLQDTSLWKFFFSRLYLLPLFPKIVWIDKLHDLTKGFSSYKGCHGNRKNIFFQLS